MLHCGWRILALFFLIATSDLNNKSCSTQEQFLSILKLTHFFSCQDWNLLFMLLFHVILIIVICCILPLVRLLEIVHSGKIQLKDFSVAQSMKILVLASLFWLHYTIQFTVLLFLFKVFNSLTPPSKSLSYCAIALLVGLRGFQISPSSGCSEVFGIASHQVLPLSRLLNQM